MQDELILFRKMQEGDWCAFFLGGWLSDRNATGLY